MKQVQVRIPALGNAADVEVIEIAVAEGTVVAAEQTLLTLESDKASMEVPAPVAGTVRGIRVKLGDRVSEGDAILAIETAAEVEAGAPAVAVAEEPAAVAAAVEPETGATGVDSGTAPAAPEVVLAIGSAAPTAANTVELVVPDLGNVDAAEVIELSARVGEHVAEGAALMVLESDKASMEVPVPAAGEIVELAVAVGDRVVAGQRIGSLRGAQGVIAAAAPQVQAPRTATPQQLQAPRTATPPDAGTIAAAAAAGGKVDEGDAGAAISRVFAQEQRRLAEHHHSAPAPSASSAVYAGPAVRQLARELGVDLPAVHGSGPKGRVRKEDLRVYVRERLAAPPQAPVAALPAIPEVDFAAFGPVETVALGAIQKATVTNMTRSWLNVPHVTQFDLADVGDLEDFRAGLKTEMQARGNKLTPLPFVLLAVARALREHPRFNASLAPDGAQLVLKKYCHIGIAVDTPQGLVVPVLRDVDRKSVWDIAAEARELAERARNRKLKLADMQGGCFTVSSLGGIGGEGFTPIVNAPEVAILGVSKLAIRPVWNGSAFVPRQTLPLSLSYDHRVVNGADAGNFLSFLVGLLGDIRRLLL